LWGWLVVAGFAGQASGQVSTVIAEAATEPGDAQDSNTAAPPIVPNVAGKSVLSREPTLFSEQDGESGAQKPGAERDKSTASDTVEEEFEGDLNLPILELQRFMDVQRQTITGEGNSQGEVTLINLNKHVNRWYLLRILWPNQHNIDWYHLENPEPNKSHLSLSPAFPGGLVIKTGSGRQIYCDLWSAASGYRIKLAKFKKKPYADVCKGQIYLRNRIEGYRTTKEWIVEFLRDRVWGGEAITQIVKNTIYKDKFFIDGDSKSKKAADQIVSKKPKRRLGPLDAKVGKEYQGHQIEAEDLGIKVRGAEKNMMNLGKWYPSLKQPGVFLSVMEAQAVDGKILSSFKKYVKDLDKMEGKAVNYLIAFDLNQFDINYALGTEHPRVNWSRRVRAKYRDRNLPGPDGFDSVEPLATTGLVPPHLSRYIVATFTGGFKRSHGAFKWGPLSRSSFGHHYGFMESGVVMSRLHSQLASFLIFQDGHVELKTWEDEDFDRLPQMRHVRQNGVPIIRFDEELQQGVPGPFVSNWTMGNWSGSQDSKFRTLRAGICLQTTDQSRYLIYGYFSSVTPTAMARVFQSFACDYALHLDMNALEHTYLALYAKDKGKDNTPNQLIKGMKVLDERFKGNVPRFIGYPDNRDFFYLTRKPGQ
jgi:hypothetical protein